MAVAHAGLGRLKQSWLIFLFSVQKWPLAIALLTTGYKIAVQYVTKKHVSVLRGPQHNGRHTCFGPPPHVNLPPGVQIRSALVPLGCTLVHISHHCQHISVFKTEPITCAKSVEPLRTCVWDHNINVNLWFIKMFFCVVLFETSCRQDVEHQTGPC